MTCFSPLAAWQTDSGEIVFVERGRIWRSLELPCGQCIGCRLERSRQWAVRCVHEASLYDSNAFVTLTYDDAHCATSLDYRDFQLFMKRLRKRFPCVRFYMCGEYGELSFRPHFHAILFNIRFPDLVSVGKDLYRSPILEDLWGFGFSSVGSVTFDSAAYVARYVMKKITGDAADVHYSRTDIRTGEVVRCVPEFTRMSLKPAVGLNWIRLYFAEVMANSGVVVNGHVTDIPKYYKQYLKDTDWFVGYTLDREAFFDARGNDSSPERLLVREAVAHARVRLKSRSL